MDADDSDVPLGVIGKIVALLAHKDVRQFVKFCIVGATSTVVNIVATNVIYKVGHQSLFSAIVVAFFLSALNGFFWNRRWTFKEKRGRSKQTQYLRFTLVSLVGLVLDCSIVAGILTVATKDVVDEGPLKHFVHVAANFFTPGALKDQFPFWLYNGALIVAIGCVVFWNYFANRHWTFKH